jgi:hypothetical protein
LGRSEIRLVGGIGDEEGEVSSGGTAHNGDTVGIDAELIRLGAKVADSVFAVL